MFIFCCFSLFKTNLLDFTKHYIRSDLRHFFNKHVGYVLSCVWCFCCQIITGVNLFCLVVRSHSTMKRKTQQQHNTNNIWTIQLIPPAVFLFYMCSLVVCLVVFLNYCFFFTWFSNINPEFHQTARTNLFEALFFHFGIWSVMVFVVYLFCNYYVCKLKLIVGNVFHVFDMVCDVLCASAAQSLRM